MAQGLLGEGRLHRGIREDKGEHGRLGRAKPWPYHAGALGHAGDFDRRAIYLDLPCGFFFHCIGREHGPGHVVEPVFIQPGA